MTSLMIIGAFLQLKSINFTNLKDAEYV